jgi:hypothetical protein
MSEVVAEEGPSFLQLDRIGSDRLSAEKVTLDASIIDEMMHHKYMVGLEH